MDRIRVYLADGMLPTEVKEAEQVKKRANWFLLYDEILYECSYTQLLLRCVTPEMGQKVLEEIHEGVCNSHIGSRVLAVATIRIGYYWPSLREDTMSLVQKYDKCQKFTPVQQKPTTPLTPIISALPFAA